MKVKVDEKKWLGLGEPCFIVAEMSANHNQSFEKAVDIVRAAKEAGADAIKLQTYTPDTITINSKDKLFMIGEGSTWEGMNLYQLYEEAYTPWDWQPKLKELAEELGIVFFSSPFDPTAVDFLEEMEVPLYKIASFELVDLPLIRHAALKGKPLIISTGMASLGEIEEAVRTVLETGNDQIILLKCVSAYPAPPEEMNLRTIRHLGETFQCPAGLSDHTLGDEVAIAAVVAGACIVEKHFTLSRKDGGPDASFSMEPGEFADMVRKIRTVEKAMGLVNYSPTEKERINRQFRRSLFVVRGMKKGEPFSPDTVQSKRPSAGLMPKHLDEVLKQKAAVDIPAGTPLRWEHVL